LEYAGARTSARRPSPRRSADATSRASGSAGSCTSPFFGLCAAASIVVGIGFDELTSQTAILAWAIASVQTFLVYEPAAILFMATLSHIVASLLGIEVGRE
jgi:hypothetical protein